MPYVGPRRLTHLLAQKVWKEGYLGSFALTSYFMMATSMKVELNIASSISPTFFMSAVQARTRGRA